MNKFIIIMLSILLLFIGVISYVYKDGIVLYSKGYSINDITYLNNNLSKENIKKLKKYDFLKDLILLLKNDEYDDGNFDIYLRELSKGSSIEETFENVNPDIVSFKQEKYYIKSNLKRYLDYLNDNKELSFKEIVTRVNSNLDHDFYIDTYKANYDDGKLILVNKFSYIEKDYSASLVDMEKCTRQSNAKMNKEAYNEFVSMCEDAQKDGIIIYNVSAYRTFSTQQTFYDNYVKRDGVQKADTYSARPGHSEHQTGYATDINTASSKAAFEKTREYNWLINNSYKYGFILRYPEGKEYITGYKYEPWHYRYVGEDVAKYIYENDITYEEYYAFFIANKNVD